MSSVYEYDRNMDVANTYVWNSDGSSNKKILQEDLSASVFEFLWGKLLKQKQNVIIRNLDAYEKVDPDMTGILRAQGIRRMIVAPFFLKKELIGFVELENPPIGSISGLSRLLDTFAGFTAILIRYRDYTKQITALNRQEKVAHQAIINDQLRKEPADGIQEMLRTIGSQYHSNRSYIFELLPNGDAVCTYEWCAEGTDEAREPLQHVFRSVFEHTIGSTLRKNQDVVIRNMNAYAMIDPEMAERLQAAGIERVVIAPAVSGKQADRDDQY